MLLVCSLYATYVKVMCWYCAGNKEKKLDKMR